MLIEDYRKFLREYLENKELYKYDNLIVLGENILEKVYIAICEQKIADKTKYFIFIIDKNKIQKFSIKASGHKDGYIRVYKKHLYKILGSKYYKIFAKNGLARSVETAYNFENYCCWHRLVLSLYTDMLNHDTHHINQKRMESDISNIVPIHTIFHEEMHKTYYDEMIGQLLQDGFIYNLRHPKKNKRQTLANNDEIIKDILKYVESNLNVKTIHKKLSRKISERTIYNILNKYHSYRKEFLEWLQRQERTPSQDLDAKSEQRWGKIYYFDRLLAKSA